jgi:SsrA-binding protein
MGLAKKPGPWYNKKAQERGVAMPQKGVKIIAQNRKARHDYFIEETFEAGIELKGTEVKSIRLGQVNLKESFAQVRKGELFVEGMHISPYEKGNIYNADPLRPKRLLMHKAEIRKLEQAVMQKGLTLVPLSIYLKDGRMKLELAICRGKKTFDKRETQAKRDAQRDMERTMRER